MYVPGWIDDPQAVAVVAATLTYPTFGATPAGQVSGDDLPKSAYLWDAYRKLFGRLPEKKNQKSVGSCVSFGTNNAVERTMAIEIAVFGEAEVFQPLVEEVTYGGSRVEVGGGRISGDGSVGAWAADFVSKWGVVARGKYGLYDLSRYDESRCRDFGRNGVPAELETEAKLHPIKETTLVKTTGELKRSLASGYGVAVCSNQGFSMQRDERGVARASGSWAHCMCIDGYHDADDGRTYYHIENSWGPDAHTGPTGWGDPGTGGFWADEQTVSRMLSQGDTWAFAGVSGFPARQLTHLI